jgi:hypothetical protein
MNKTSEKISTCAGYRSIISNGFFAEAKKEGVKLYSYNR